jgi:hypothetical protein
VFVACSTCSLVLAVAVVFALRSVESFLPCYVDYNDVRVLATWQCKAASAARWWLLLSAGAALVLLLAVVARKILVARAYQPSMAHASGGSGRSSAAVPKVVQWLAVLSSTALSAVLLYGLMFIRSEYRPSGAGLLQQIAVAFAVAGLSMCLSVYLLTRPLLRAERTRTAYVWLFASIGSAFALNLRPMLGLIRDWDMPALLFALLAVVSTVASGSLVLDSKN